MCKELVQFLFMLCFCSYFLATFLLAVKIDRHIFRVNHRRSRNFLN